TSWKNIVAVPVLLFTGPLLLEACAEPDVADSIDPVEVKTSALTDTDIALHWAPIHFQDVFKSSGTGEGGKSDYVVSFNYDGDFNGRNNWDSIDAFAVAAHVHFAVSQSDSHFFIYYMMYHPRDWAAGTAQEHENDS